MDINKLLKDNEGQDIIISEGIAYKRDVLELAKEKICPEPPIMVDIKDAFNQIKNNFNGRL